MFPCHEAYYTQENRKYVYCASEILYSLTVGFFGNYWYVLSFPYTSVYFNYTHCLSAAQPRDVSKIGIFMVVIQIMSTRLPQCWSTLLGACGWLPNCTTGLCTLFLLLLEIRDIGIQVVFELFIYFRRIFTSECNESKVLI